jgi:hypothetical protein
MISVCYTSARPALVPGVVREWIARAGDVSGIEFVVTIDASRADQCATLADLPGTRVFVNQGRPCCIDGWNLAARKARGGILIQCSDDLHPPLRWDVDIRSRLGNGDDAAVLAISDGLTAGPHFLPHAILTRRYYNELGYLFHDAYWSMWCDNEFSAVAHRRKIVVEALDIRFNHSHGQIHDEVRSKHEGPAFHGTGHQIFLFREQHAFRPWRFSAFVTEDGDSDGIYSPNWRTRLESYWNASPRTDQDYLGLHRESAARRSRMFGTRGQIEGFQVLIAAAPDRRAFLELLTAELARQGIAYLVDDRAAVVAADKRNDLVARASAGYVTFADDDEWVSHNYGELIADAIASNGDRVEAIVHDAVDSVGQGEVPKAVFFSVDGEPDEPNEPNEANAGGCCVRAPDHSIVWRRDVALREAFAAEADGDDRAWSQRMRPHLTRWARVRGLLRFRERASVSTRRT